MKKDSGKIAVMGVLSLIVAIGTLIGAAVLVNINGKNFSSGLPKNNYSENGNSSEPSRVENSSVTGSEENPSSEQAPSSEDEPAEEPVQNIETGIYTQGGDSIVVTSGEAGFVEGNINCGGITMEFSGQTVENTLTATGTDSLNNTVEITLVFGENAITASSRPVIQYEEATDYLKLSGIFSK